MGKGEGGDKRGQAEAGRGRAEGLVAGAEGQGKGQGQRAAEGPRADPFNVVDVRAGMDMSKREWRSQRESVVADILAVSEDEGGGGGEDGDGGRPRTAVGPQCAGGCQEVHPPGSAEAGGRQGRPRAARGGSGMEQRQQRKRRRERADGQGRERAGRDVGDCARKGTAGRKGGKREWTGATVAAAPTLFQAVAAKVAPTGSAAVRAEEEREVRRQQAAWYEALSHVEHQRRRRQPPEQGPDTIYHLEMDPGRTGMRGGQAEQSSAAVQGSGAGQVEGGKGKQGKGARQQGLQGKGQGRAGLHGVGGRGRGAKGRQGKGQGKESGLGYMGSPVFPGKGLGWWGGVVPPAVPPIVPPFPPPPYPAMGMVYPPLSAYPGMQPQAHMQQHQQAGGTALGAQEGKGKERRRTPERLGKAERSLREREARVKGEVGGAEEGRTEGTNRPQGGEAQAVEELQMTWADLQRVQEGVGWAEREGGRQEEGRRREGTPLVPFRQPAIPREQEGEMQERAWRRIRGEAARLAERDRDVAAKERRVREEEEAVARGAQRVLPDPEGDTCSTNVEGRSPSGKRAREEDEEAGKERGKRRRGEERGAGEAEGAPQLASPSQEPTPTDWDSKSPLPRRYAPPPVRRGPGTVAGWTKGEVAELARYVKWAGKTRGRREKRGPCPFSDLVGRAGRPRERGPEMDEGRWRRMLGAALPGVRPDCLQEKGKKPRV